MSTDIAYGSDGIDPRLALDFAEVADICALLERAATLLAGTTGDDTDGECCHQTFQTGHWRDSTLVAGWLTELATDLNKRSHAALDTAAAELADQPTTRPTTKPTTRPTTRPTASSEGRF